VQKKVCYLTFDDGPSKNSEEILDILAKYDAKATFFLIGSEIREENRLIIERIIEEGHAVGLHSNVHRFDKLYTGVDVCVQDFEVQYKLLKEEYGIDTKIFRFPGGSACSYMNGQRQSYITAMREKGYVGFDWHVSGEDSYGNPTVWSIQKNIFEDIDCYESPIILLHDINIADATVDALPGILEQIKNKGYSFETLNGAEEYIYR
jgi:peptidoglycan/xylan/chitin deacetylase (PgdA/CDA1 family)